MTETRQVAIESTGWKDHAVLWHDGAGGYETKPAQYRFLGCPGAKYTFPFGVAQMDNGEVLVLASAERPGTDVVFTPVVYISRDGGETWSDPEPVLGAQGCRPMMLSDLGGGTLCFQGAVGASVSGERFYSHDYGRTWPERVAVQALEGGGGFNVEGNPLIEPTSGGVQVAEIGYVVPDTQPWWKAVWRNRLRWSDDGGRSWRDETMPDAWLLACEYGGKRYVLGSGKGSLTK